MKKKLILMTLALLMLSTFAFSQDNFKWERTDSVAKTKDQIYSATKMFIAEQWKSAKDVIQNDDKDGGMILVRGITEQLATYALGYVDYFYSYNVTFKMKNGKYKIIIDNVQCDRAHNDKGYTATCFEPFEGDNYPSNFGMNSKKKVSAMMLKIKVELQSIVDNYEQYIKTKTASTENW